MLSGLPYLLYATYSRGHAEHSENTVIERCLTKKEQMKGDEGVGL